MNSSSWAFSFGFVKVVCAVVDVDPAGSSDDESSMRRRLLGRGVGTSFAPL
jgi:hypothetical protein